MTAALYDIKKLGPIKKRNQKNFVLIQPKLLTIWKLSNLNKPVHYTCLMYIIFSPCLLNPQSIGKGSLWCVDPEYRPNLLQALRKTPYHPYHHVLPYNSHPYQYHQGPLCNISRYVLHFSFELWQISCFDLFDCNASNVTFLPLLTM